MQRLITLSTSCWVWGEHEGFLQPLLESVRLYTASELLDATAFRFSEEDDDQLVAHMIKGSDRLSWLNRFTREDFPNEATLLIDRIFSAHLPKGWANWGFKEIRYGSSNRSPEILLNLFPSATAIFTFRDPARTIQSMIRTWGNLQLFKEGDQSAALIHTYRHCTDLWKRVIKYFVEWRRASSKTVYFVSEDKLSWPVHRILNILNLEIVRETPTDLAITNPGPDLPAALTAQFEALFCEDEAECKQLYAQARDMSEQDFNR